MPSEPDFKAEEIPEREWVDMPDYPEDVRPFLRRVCQLWMLRPPAHKKDKAYWIEGGRRLRDACAEFGVKVLDEEFARWNELLHKQRSYTVEGPGSLVKTCRAMAARMRAEKAWWD